MKELSIFVDESGDFGKYEKHSPYYTLSVCQDDYLLIYICQYFSPIFS